MVAACLTPPRRGLEADGVDASSLVIFAFFERRAGAACAVVGLESGLGSRAFRL